MPWLVRWVGVVVTLGLVGVSLMMNFRFGQSLGKSEWDGLVYGIASACADGFKVILPFAIMAAWSARRPIAAGAGAALWLVFTAYSMTSSLGHSAVNRSETAGARQHHVAAYKDLRRALELKLQEREKLPAFRAQDALRAELAAMEQSAVFERSGGCSEMAGRTRSFCDAHARLKSELATALRAQMLDKDIVELRASIEAAAERGKSGEGDAQSAILGKLSGWTEDYVRLGLTVLVSVMVELGSGLGLYLVLGHRAADTTPRRQAPAWLTRLLAASSDERRWRGERLVAAAGEHEDELTLYRDYCMWLVTQRRGPAKSLTEFRVWLDAEPVGEGMAKRGRRYRLGVRLRARSEETADAQVLLIGRR